MGTKAYRICSKCATRRKAEEERCPACGTKRSRLVKPRAVSFWRLPEYQREKIARAMFSAAKGSLRLEQAENHICSNLGLPGFKEFRRYYRCLVFSLITDGEHNLKHDWYVTKPDLLHNPFTGFLWPKRQ